MPKHRTTPRDLSLKAIREKALGARPPRKIVTTVAMPRDARDVLLALLAEIEVFGELGGQVKTGTPRELVELRDLGIPYQPAAWFGGPLDGARRKAYSRAATWLEGAGLVLRTTQPRRPRVTHLQLTAAGLRRALELAGRSADRAAIAEGLGHTRWGQQLAGEIGADRRLRASDPRVARAQKAMRNFGR